MGIVFGNEHWMREAITCAKQAEQAGEVPVGAVLVYNNQLITKAHNQPITQQDPTAHAEIQAIRQAALALGNYRLVDTTLYVTLEPCAMCMGAIAHARIKNLIYGAHDPKTGLQNHQVNVQGGILETDCGEILRAFFRERR